MRRNKESVHEVESHQFTECFENLSDFEPYEQKLFKLCHIYQYLVIHKKSPRRFEL